MDAWSNFAVALVGASAALVGLIFVSVSINLTRILSFPQLPARAAGALVLLLAVFIESTLLLVPGQSTTLVGIELLVGGIVFWGYGTRLELGSFRLTVKDYKGPAAWNLFLSQLALVPFIIAGIAVLLRGTDGLYWLVPGVIFSFLKSIADAWVLLVEINR